MDEKYLRHYRTLGLMAGCTQQDVKASYHRLAGKWHPDRLIGHPAAKDKKESEEKIKEINHAYWSLSSYYRKHGRLPLEPLSSAAETSGGAATEQHLYNVSANEKSPQSLSFFVRLIIGAALGLGLAFTVWHSDLTPENDGFFPPQYSLEDSPLGGKKYFSVDSKPGDVYAIQGTPTKTENGVWHYGKSRVYFENGVVTSWVEDSGHPLMVSRTEESGQGSSPLVKRFFSVGSTKQEVRAIQGAPLRETDALWEYRVSRIYFKNDRVTSWYSSPLDPLRAQSK